MNQPDTAGSAAPAALDANAPPLSSETPVSPDSYSQDNKALLTLSWGLFGRMLFAQSAPLLLAAAVVCFFAFNWATMPLFAKFGLLGVLLLGSLALALWQGLSSMTGSLALLFCGLLTGPLLAVYGQAYQTGADSWELFRAWALLLLPLALAGRQNGLWVALWLVGSLWIGLYLNEREPFFSSYNGASDSLFFLVLIQAVAVLLWETAACILAGPARTFLRARWLPRVMAFPLMGCLTCMLATQMLFIRETLDSLYILLYLAILGGGAPYYTRRQKDLIMIAYGLLSLIILAAALPLIGISRSEFLLGGRLLLVALILVGGAGVAIKILRALHKQKTATTIFSQTIDSECGGKEQQSSLGQSSPKGETDSQHIPPLADAPCSHIAPSPVENPVHSPIPTSPSPQTTDSGEKLSLALTYEPIFLRFALLGVLPTQKIAPARSDIPWVSSFLSGLCAWIAAPFLMASSIQILTIFLGTSNHATALLLLLILLLLIMGGGAFLSRTRQGIFWEQTALCLALTGTLGAGYLCADTYDIQFIHAPTLILFAVGYPFVENSLYRFFAAAIGLPLLALTLLTPNQGRMFSNYAYSTAGDTLPLFLAGAAVFFVSLCVALAHFRTLPKNGPGLSSPQERYWGPLFTGCQCALLVMAALPFAVYIPSFRMLGPGAGAGIAYFAFRLSGRLALPPACRFALLALGVAIAALSFKLPWLGTGLFVLILARQAASLPFMALATAFLALCINWEYYSLATSLLHKSISLAAIGLLLLCAAIGLHLLVSAAIRKGRLPALSTLFGAPAPPAPHSLSNEKAGEANAPPASAIPPLFSAFTRLHFLREGVVIVTLAAFSLLFTWAALQKEHLLASGDSVILALRPRDPRSIIQGDYMDINFALEENIRSALPALSSTHAPLTGTVVVQKHTDGSFSFKRLDDGSPLTGDEKRIVFRSRRQAIRISSGAFFFQEGHGQAYEQARFALLRVDDAGNSLISRLLDERMNIIQPVKDPVLEDKLPVFP